MLDYDTQARLAGATAELLRSCAVAAAQTMTASACQGLTLWSDMLRPPRRPPAPAVMRASCANPFEVLWRFTPSDWMPKAGVWPQAAWVPSPALGLGWSPYAAWSALPNWSAWGRIYWQQWPSQPQQLSPLSVPETVTRAALGLASPSSYATYRSAGGHAVAQIITPNADTVVAGLAASSLALMQMQTIFSTWRTVLGA
ncbi:MAG TPA: hypothetical protein VFR73_01745 [Hyphomicrobiaceae bacterium]|nr:hypothetical protein [Hyphomicrobiaceae bacterium]